ncbi:MAG: hypothetical protein A3H52_00735 [Candidatus Zambryskibacteria bacterium RIFCSPLOWO2_02_FULL_39_26]|uniref:Primosomal protein N' 3' DNA-binding domain-containing protein n=1 Tax=Candidatus Zambryskibacteria bacterium RIFCSPLOWO2_12_FULL_39_23 TaxID=1802776 RepID=A0A1G2UT72_9BACT|nr:MAG: hypothetical protein A2W51_00595 [Candidatus Zambryskibacteria bacterium RIFCSPHIGHO2_02_39_10]OHA99841.1 MAG: hypothetical protein A3E59_02265 [Candidatus Zambryskibacteria bacterium RIFCSPHIGHO2_12_FULL_39_47]OHB10246.1 MAG: hypothetical protein A3H52_00735 [Candidatus Zambryskibacteria bacterium RIFCSPLOWO2_02_FULL_39_26]OHB12585.1 MAG: hypothetical protein A3G99_02070 [Candidatus Zambryskibacteria bacterium RIFCSPLOWO2_12_FULL_39_23]
MYLLTVIPISRGVGKDSLTYFAKTNPPIGSLISIPLRKKSGFGLVVESKKALDSKSEIKSLPYGIRKIGQTKTDRFLSDSFVASAKKIADYHAGEVGAVLSVLIPKTILDQSADLEYKTQEKPVGIFYETLLLQSDNSERYATYKSLVREEFAKNRSVFFCLPTTEDLLNATSVLEKGIEKYTFTIQAGFSKKEIVRLWREIIESPHPVLIIATGSFLSIPRSDLGTIVLEKESSRAYKMQSRPFIDIRAAVEIIARETNIRLVLGDSLLRIETLWELKNPNRDMTYSELSPLKFRSLSTNGSEIVNMRFPQDMKKKEFTIFGQKLKSIIRNTIENNEHTFLFCGRKGLFPITVCSDCGTVVVCRNCNAPVVLYSKSSQKTVTGKGNLFVCNHCGERREADELCIHCKGWRLNPMGIGTENVAKEVAAILPKVKIFIMDKENVKTHKQAVKVRDLFYATPGSLMVGTEMALSYLNQKIENCAVVSIDSYFTIPDFQINEKIFHILLSIRDLALKNFLIQTRKENIKIFDYAVKGNLLDFFRDEIDDRKSIGYPPFATYIKITLEGEKTTVKEEMEGIKEFLKPYEVNIFDAWNPGGKTKYTMHGLISIPKDKWVDKELLLKLRSLPQYCLVKVNPATLL